MKLLRLLTTAVFLLSFSVSAYGDLGKDLLKSAMKGDVDTVKNLVGQGADVNSSTNKGLTPLILASLKGHKEVSDFLINKNADINAKDARGMTALMAASKQGHIEAVKLLLDKGRP